MSEDRAKAGARPSLRSWLAEGPFTLAMSSGFFGFFAHTGMLRELVAAGFTPSALAGSSAGALVGGAFAAGVAPDDLARVLSALERDQFWDPRLGFGLLAGGKFDALLRRILPVTQIERCALPLAISVFDIARASTVVVRAGDLPRAIRASCAVPGLFHPVWIDGRAYWDGGILDRPGIAGIAAGERVLYHHIASRSPWRTSLTIPSRRGMVALAIDDLPRSGPFKLDAGRAAMELAAIAAREALDAPIPENAVLRTNSRRAGHLAPTA